MTKKVEADPAEVAAALEAIRTRATVDVPTAGKALGLTRIATYNEIRDGKIEVLRYGKDERRIRVISAPLRRTLGLSVA
jgi:hypothetical protein